jgi:preprotein translocase subunit SecB
MNQPPLRLERHYYEEVHTRLNPDLKPSEIPTPFEVGLWSSVLENKEDPFKFMLKMRIVVPYPPQETIPIQGSFEIVGFFTVEESVPKDQRASLVKVTGGAMLYSAAREFVLLVTFRTTLFPPFYLPTLSGKALAEAPDLHPKSTPEKISRKTSRTRRKKTS